MVKLAVCVVVIALQLLVHVASFSSGAHITMRHAAVLLLVSLGTVGFMFFVPRDPSLKAKGGLARVSQREMWAVLPGRLKGALALLGGYMAIIVIVSVLALREGGPIERDGRYWAANKRFGSVAQPITEGEYWSLQSHGVRLLTTMGALLVLIPISALVWHARRQQGAAEPAVAADDASRRR